MSGKAIEVYPVGSMVFIKTAGEEMIPARVMAVGIYPGNQVQYLAEWWNGTTRSQEWVHTMNVATEESASLRIGFAS